MYKYNPFLITTSELIENQNTNCKKQSNIAHQINTLQIYINYFVKKRQLIKYFNYFCCVNKIKHCFAF